MSRTVIASVVRVPWHSTHGGYDQLLDHLPEVHRVTAPIGLLTRRVASAAHQLARPWHPPSFYPAEHFATDLRILASRHPAHVLYGEEQFWFSRHRHVPTAVTYHQPPENLTMLMPHAAWKKVASRANHVIVVSPSQRDFFARHLAEERIHLVPHGVDTDTFSPLGTPDFSAPPLVLTVGWWLRDWDVLDAVHDRLHHRYGRQIRLALVTRRDAAQNRHPAIRVLEGIGEAELVSLYRAATVVLLPLLGATANNALLEALACGTPVVATDVGGVRHYTGNGPGAVLTPPGDSLAAAEATEVLLAEAGTACHTARRTAARDRAQEFTWPHVAHQVREVYRLLGEE
ncbi:glycosyltransferase family 4 protein [Streptomyces albus]|uniref:glycosyltransferase family 4 protein n=1 Tax=Streptomyces albus TaxID=1888 RepID=UPI0004C93E5C|nr:glycosyltransferase family 4 protein [Streptomyces albus]